MPGEREVFVSAAAKLGDRAVDVVHAFADALERRSAELPSGAADVMRAAIVERKKREAILGKNARELIRTRALEDRRAPGAVQPEDRAARPRGLEQHAGEGDAVGGVESNQPAERLATTSCRASSHRHILSRVRCAPPSQKSALLRSMKSA